MHRNTPFLRSKSPRYRSLPQRHLRLLCKLTNRLTRRWAVRTTLFGGWAWLAAGSLIGFEAFEIIFGAVALAPELLPFIILSLALTWWLRRRARRIRARASAYRRLRRIKHNPSTIGCPERRAIAPIMPCTRLFWCAWARANGPRSTWLNARQRERANAKSCAASNATQPEKSTVRSPIPGPHPTTPTSAAGGQTSA